MLVNLGDAVCLGPKPSLKPKLFSVPANAWDCHAHVIGVPPAYPYVTPRHFTPFPVSPEDFLSVLDTEGFRYGVAVQISVHGTDNSYLVEALKQHPDRLVGVAVIDKSTTDKALAAMKEAGVTGIRLLEAKGGVGTDDLAWFGDRCAELGWNLQLCVESTRYADLMPQLIKLRAPLVMDHMGWFTIEETVAGRGFQSVLRLLRETDAWLKMSGGFRFSHQSSPYADTMPFMRELIRTAPDKLVWGSDWPHVAFIDAEKMPQYGDLLDGLWDAADDKTVIRKILVDNPMKLYGRKFS